jgi:hypothetical protein
MHTDRTDSSLADEHTADPVTHKPATEAAIMGLLLSGGHAGIWTRSEIELESSASPLDVQDALAALQASGLIHLHDELVTPTRAAQRMDELEL